MNVSFLKADNLTDISHELLDENNKIKLLPSDHYKKYKWEDFRLFCHNHARYGIPTIWLIDYLKDIIKDRKCIEIGAGAGDLGYHLGVTMTDSKQQDNPVIKKMYQDAMQPTIKYPKDVIKIEALEAVKKYKPKVVIGSWITTYSPVETTYGSNPFGVKEKEILDLVDTLIIIGNMKIHGDKPILQYSNEIILSPYIISRAKNPEYNCIMIWNKN